MPIPPGKKNQIKLDFYKEAVVKLERCFNDLAVSFMPVNGTWFYYMGKTEWVGTSKLFENVEIVVEKKNYTRVIDYLDNINTIVKIASIENKSAYSFSFEGFDAVRVDIYHAIHFPHGIALSSEELFNHAEKKDGTYVVLPSCEDVLQLLFCKTSHFSDQFLDPTLVNAVRFVTASSAFSWEKFWECSRKKNMVRCSSFYLTWYKRRSKEPVPFLKVSLYSWLLTTGISWSCYRVYPRIIRKLLYKVLLSDNPLKYLFEHAIFNITRNFTAIWNIAYNAVIGRVAKKYVIENEVSVFRALTKSAKKRFSELPLGYSLQEDFIIGASSGIWYLRGERLFQITYGASYGITHNGSRWFANQNMGQFSRILSFEIDTESERPRIVDQSSFALGLPKNVHQIDYCDNRFFVVDTQNNRIITINDNGKKGYYFPNKRIKGKKHNNHFNSVFITDNKIYVCGHNGTLNPRQSSELYILDKKRMKKQEILQTNAYCAHNMLVKDGHVFYCDSMAGALMRNSEVAYKNAGYFMRGIAFTDRYMVIGGSKFARREERESSDSVIYILDNRLKHLKTVSLQSIGQVYEIRGVNNDYGLSLINANGNKGCG